MNFIDTSTGEWLNYQAQVHHLQYLTLYIKCNSIHWINLLINIRQGVMNSTRLCILVIMFAVGMGGNKVKV